MHCYYVVYCASKTVATRQFLLVLVHSHTFTFPLYSMHPRPFALTQVFSLERMLYHWYAIHRTVDMQTDEGISQIAFRGVGQVHLVALQKERAECRARSNYQGVEKEDHCQYSNYSPKTPPAGSHYAIDLMKGYSDCPTRAGFDRYGAIAYV